MEPLEDASTFDDVVRNLDLVIDWSIRANSTIGYFAALYKRGTIAIQRATRAGEFTDAQWIEQLDCVFARRYFDALNAFFHPSSHDPEALTLPWEIAFLNQHNRKASMLQHMVASLNAHICFDLGIAVVDLAANRLPDIHADFERVNDLVSLQTPDMLDIVQRRSPGGAVAALGDPQGRRVHQGHSDQVPGGSLELRDQSGRISGGCARETGPPARLGGRPGRLLSGAAGEVAADRARAAKYHHR
ncbi:hypothetical protein ATO49_04600 [Mycolicibacterium fortuitum subsp. fortuitum DSM 46621 = ATCC 6841 = JCM 6387]|nr:hypothetical protein ATO49_04600 [Mycolicibacterium fortuitum subsp. fortuitum DSM 46621 = ATCC 6841 = JCM 6387]